MPFNYSFLVLLIACIALIAIPVFLYDMVKARAVEPWSVKLLDAVGICLSIAAVILGAKTFSEDGISMAVPRPTCAQIESDPAQYRSYVESYALELPADAKTKLLKVYAERVINESYSLDEFDTLLALQSASYQDEMGKEVASEVLRGNR